MCEVQEAGRSEKSLVGRWSPTHSRLRLLCAIVWNFADIPYAMTTSHSTPHALPDRIRTKFEIVGDPDDECWLWTASLRDGYGQLRYEGRIRGAHVVIYELLVGPVPTELELDHLCRARRCVNPAHMEPVTHAINLWRGVGVGSAVRSGLEAPAY